MKLDYDEALFGKIWPYIKDNDVTDIKWNGSQLWITSLSKGRYMAKEKDGTSLTLDSDWIRIFCSRIATSINENFNRSEPSLKAETSELRIQAEHESVSGDNTFAIAIRKTPSVSRLKNQDLVKNGYASKIVDKLLPCLIRARLSGVVTGDVGAGKTELEKYLCGFIPSTDPIVTVEDTAEMRLKTLYPDKDIYMMRITDEFTAERAIRDSLRLNTKWLIISEARGREIVLIMEGASTGCVAMCSIHAENVWEIPDRIMNMVGDSSRVGFENDVYTFFDYAIKVKADIDENGVHRSIDQICFFDRDEGENKIYRFVEDGILTGERLPARIEKKLKMNEENEFLELYVDVMKRIQNGEAPEEGMTKEEKSIAGAFDEKDATRYETRASEVEVEETDEEELADNLDADLKDIEDLKVEEEVETPTESTFADPLDNLDLSDLSLGE